MKPFDINNVHREIEMAMRQPFSDPPPLPSPEDFAPKHHTAVPDLPDYLLPTDNVSAKNVALQYEAAAKEIEAMGAELKEASQRAEAMAAKVSDAIKYVEETAAAYRSEAKKIFERIEQVSLMTDEVRETCNGLMQRIKEQ